MVRVDVIDQLEGERAVGCSVDRVGLESVPVVDEVHRERGDPTASSGAQPASGECRHHGGVEPAGEQRAQRGVGDELAIDDVLQQRPHGADRRVQVVGVLRRLESPVGPLGETLSPDTDDVARPDLRDPGEDRLPGGLDQLQELAESAPVEAPGHVRVGQDRLGLRSEEHAVGAGQ